MGNKLVKITTTTDLLIKQGVDEFLRHHPEMKEMHISYNKIIYEMARYYLGIE